MDFKKSLERFRLVEDKFRNIETMLDKAEKLVSKHPEWTSTGHAAKNALRRLRDRQAEYYKDDRPNVSRSELFKTLVKKSGDFTSPLSKNKQRQFKGLMKTATPDEIKSFKDRSDTLASMRAGEVENPHNHIKKVKSNHYSINHPEKDETYTLKKNTQRSYPGADYWDLHHDSSGDRAGEFQVNKDKEIKWSNIYGRFRGAKLSPKVYTVLAKHYGEIKSDPHVTLLPGRGTWMHLKRQRLHGVEPMRGKDAKSSVSRWEDEPEGTGDQRYSYKHPPEVKKSVEKKRALDKSKVLPK